ncbi:MAG: PilN family type IVB pilus formation outer membrane protein [Sterolibacterium sp.]|nr:PilN family type IVB pilus formation outer membrane protein [Sterolibacterium sp.]
MRPTAKTTLIPLLLISLLATAGCASKRVAPMQKNVSATNEEIGKYLQEINRSHAGSKAVVDNAEGIWLPVRKLRDNELQVSGHRATSRRFSINREFRTIQDVAERVTLLMGVPVTVAPEALPSAQATQAGATANPAPQPSLPGMAPAFGYAMPGGGQNGVPISYDGPLSGFLDVAAARFGLSWEWMGDGIRFYRYTTRTFRLAALPGETILQNMVSNSTGGSSSGGSSDSTSSETKQKTQVDSKLSVWSAIEDSIKGMLSEKGTVTVTAATGTVTVTDRPEIVSQVGKYIESQNASLSKQVVVNVRVLSVELSNGEQYGINWGLAYQSMSGNLGFKFSNNFIDPASAGGSNLALNVLTTAGQATNSDIQSWAGSQALINALSSQGHVSQITSASLTTLNNQSAPLQVGRQTTYLASSTTTVTQGAGSTTTLQPGMLTTGFSMTIVPHILDRGRLMLQYAVDISSLLRMYTVNSNNSSIQAPDVDTRNFLQRVMLNSGDTLVMTGFEQSTTNATTEGMGKASNPMLGGGVNGKRNRSVLVILIQPIVAD